MKKNILWMIIGCGLPLLLIFIAPALGISDTISLFIFIIAMFACHLLMPVHHKDHQYGSHDIHSKTSKTSKTENHENHSS